MTASIENQPLARLALTVADCLEDQSTPASLMDSLREVASSLIDELSSGSVVTELRALAALNVSVDAGVTPQAEMLNAGHPESKATVYAH